MFLILKALLPLNFSIVFSAFAYYKSFSYLTKCEGIEDKYIYINEINRINKINRINRINKIVKELLFDLERV